MVMHEQQARQAKLNIATEMIDRAAAADQRNIVDATPQQRKPKALIVIHGMGQQLRFETLDAIANGLHREDVRLYGASEDRSVRATCVQFGDKRLERFEMKLRTGAHDGKMTPAYESVHVYEGYWSPLTQSAVTLRDVARFLFWAGLHGVRNAGGTFAHWAFGKKRNRFVPVQTLVFLVLTLALLASLVVINTAIVVIPAARSPFTTPPAWLSDGLFRDLTDVFNAVLIILIAFGVLISVSLFAGARRFGKTVKMLLAVPLLVASALSLFAIVAAGVAVPLLFTLHGAATDPDVLLIRDEIRSLGSWTPNVVLIGAGIAAVTVMVSFASSLVIGYGRQFADRERWSRLVTSTIVIALFSLMLFYIGIIAWNLLDTQAFDLSSKSRRVLKDGPVWAALVGVSFVVRGFLVQYVGDVAIYVSSHTVDRFHDLRAKIKDAVWNTAHAVYAQKSDGREYDYDEIVVSGHSLGSVIAYDTLNRLLLDDATATAGAGKVLDVAARTKLLLTFGSPLDKTAFLFANQSKGTLTSDARESLAAIAQPLIDNRTVRDKIRWRNIFSPWDIISGGLDYYNDPETPGNDVVNERDPEAVTLLAAHTEYWRNRLVFKCLYEELNPSRSEA